MHQQAFAARVPVVVRILVEQQVIELTVPSFAESYLPFVDWAHLPQRYMSFISNVCFEVERLLPTQGVAVDMARLANYLELAQNAEDMGWRVAPQHGGEFELTQKALPLKKVLRQINDGIRRECYRLNKPNPLANFDIYALFRAIKERSHTFSMVQKVRLVSSRKPCELTIYFGKLGEAHLPLLSLLGTSPIDETLMASLRDQLAASSRAELSSIYSLEAILSRNEA